ncbi:MAG: XTP/dITP diphosphatase [bacterium]
MSQELEIVIASGNQGKIEEIKDILKDWRVKILSLRDYPDMAPIVEDGRTFEENAVKKAETVCRFTGKIALADDSGLEVDALNGAPGVMSARYAGEGATKEALNKKLLKAMEDVPEQKRTARFRCVMAIAQPDRQTQVVSGKCEGIIAHAMRGDYGFGYDPVFVVPSFGKTMAELGGEIKNRISHRALALQKALLILHSVFQEGAND